MEEIENLLPLFQKTKKSRVNKQPRTSTQDKDLKISLASRVWGARNNNKLDAHNVKKIDAHNVKKLDAQS